ncbi:hypothetical protein NQZ68_007089 [Dissostichus eleginoides]|nr:hypothetical protein NQZ68_007089 [Dissostichus eleginoides]
MSDPGTESSSLVEDDCLIPEKQARSVHGLDATGTSRSSRSTQKRLAGWPVHHILNELYGNNIPVLSGLNHEELFNFLQARESSELNVSTANKPSPHKVSAKRRVVSQPARNSPPKRQKQTDACIPEEATIMSTLLDVKSALESFNSRMYSLEQNSISAACNVNNAGPSSLTHATSAFTHAVPLPANVTPLRTLGTAVPAPAMGSSFLPPAAAIPDSLRNHILVDRYSLHSLGMAQPQLQFSAYLNQGILGC